METLDGVGAGAVNTGGLTECGAVHSHVPGSSFLVMAEDLGREMGCCFSLSGDTLSGPERLFFLVSRLRFGEVCSVQRHLMVEFCVCEHAWMCVCVCMCICMHVCIGMYECICAWMCVIECVYGHGCVCGVMWYM